MAEQVAEGRSKDFFFEPIGGGHDVLAFSCGKPSLDQYLKNRARRDQSAGIARVFVLACGAKIVGYYTLHQHTIDAGEMPGSMKKRLSNYSRYPATLIGRLAVDQRFAGKGFGRDILFEALRKALETAANAASVALVVEAIDEEAQRFYEHYGFAIIDLHNRRLCLPMKTVEKLLKPVVPRVEGPCGV